MLDDFTHDYIVARGAFLAGVLPYEAAVAFGFIDDDDDLDDEEQKQLD